MEKVLLIPLLVLLLVLIGCTAPPQTTPQTNPTQQPICKGEGEIIPVIANPPACCADLTLIQPKEPNLTGISGICTAKCGNETCDAQTETNYNCPADCKNPVPQDACASVVECNDSNSCTTDSCEGTPKACIHAAITQCMTGDSCCPSGCNNSTDGDCPVIDQCQTNSQCNDSDDSTTDLCNGTPKSCQHIQKNCVERNGQICTAQQSCPQAYISASDSTACCPTTCVQIQTDLCQNCNSDQKCVNNACVLKNCAEFGGASCPTANNTCSGYYKSASDSPECCVGACTAKPTCSSLNGSFCSETLCEGSSQQTFDTPSNKTCCTGTCQTGYCGEATAQTTGQQYIDSLLNNNYNQFSSLIAYNCTTNPASCQSAFDSDKPKAQAYSSILFNHVSETNGFSHVFFDVVLNGQPASVTLETQQNYVLGGCRVVARVWYT